MQSRDDKDWLMRQVKSFGEGLGYILSHGKSNAGVEIVLPDKAQKQLPYQDELRNLVDNKEYCKASTKLKKLRYSMEEEQFVELSRWFYKTLLKLDDLELKKCNCSRQVLLTDLSRIETMDVHNHS